MRLARSRGIPYIDNMSTYPDGIFEGRDIENLPGIAYDPTKKTTVFAEDVSAINEEIRVIEQTLGVEVNGASTTLASRLTSIDNEISARSRWIRLSTVTLETNSTNLDILALSLPLGYNHYKYEARLCGLSGGANTGTVGVRMTDASGKPIDSDTRREVYDGNSIAIVNAPIASRILDSEGVVNDCDILIEMEWLRVAGGNWHGCSAEIRVLNGTGSSVRRASGWLRSGAMPAAMNVVNLNGKNMRQGSRAYLYGRY